MKARAPGQSALLLLDVVQELTAQNIDYAVIGAMAAAVHGSIRATTDADALLSVTLPRLGKLQNSLRKAGLMAELRRGDADDPIPALLGVSDRHGNRVDLLGGLRGLDPDAFSRALTVPFQGVSLRVIGREDFIAMKCFAGGPQDIADARAALNTANNRLDIDLLRRTTRRLGRGAADVLEHLLKH
jgi:predicted nucleotidyltransferase